jgi:plastocyanin
MNKWLVIGLLVLFIGFGGYFVYKYAIQGPGTSPSTTQTQEAGALIEIKNYKHNPNRLTVKANSVVTVTNKDIVSHTVTSDTQGIFDTGLIGKDETKTFTAPAKAGEYPFHCTPHPSMTGVLVVE